MAPTERRAEEARIRRILDINSYNLDTFKDYLLQKDIVPDSTDEQAVRDAVYRLRAEYWKDIIPSSPPLSVYCIFSANTDTIKDHQRRECESLKYEAVEDLISMLATRKAQASAMNHGQGGSDEGTVVKSEEA